MSQRKNVVAVDIDGCVAEPLDSNHRHQYWLNMPIKEMIDKVNKLYEDKYVIIYYTGRALEYYEETYSWLVKNGCKFHALRMGKLSADYFIDDRNANIEDLL